MGRETGHCPFILLYHLFDFQITKFPCMKLPGLCIIFVSPECKSKLFMVDLLKIVEDMFKVVQ